MTQFLYSNARQLFATAQMDWASLTDVRLMLVSAAYAPNEADEYVDDIPGGAIIERSESLSDLEVISGWCRGVVPMFELLDDTREVIGLLLYDFSTGVDATSPLVYYTDVAIGLPFTPSALNYQIAYDLALGGFFRV